MDTHSIEASGNDLALVADLAETAGKPEIINIDTKGLGKGYPESVPVLWNRKFQTANSVKDFIDAYKTNPDRKKGTAQVDTRDSFTELVNRHKTDDSAIFADTNWKKPSLTAVIDYHEAKSGGAADNLSHRVKYEFPLSDEWQTWIASNANSMSQEEFAYWIEDRIPDLASPTDAERNEWEPHFKTKFAVPSELITLSRGLKVNVDSEVKNSQNLQSGEGEVTFNETHRDADGKPIIIPGLFILAIAPFVMGEKVTIPVRLRYRVRQGKVNWWYEIFRPDTFITERVRDDLATVATATELPVYEGKPES